MIALIGSGCYILRLLVQKHCSVGRANHWLGHS